MESLSFAQSIEYSFVGLATVFAVLCLLYIVIVLQSKIVGMFSKKKPQQQQPLIEQKVTDEGVTLVDVDDETAAMIMAIVADTSKIPLEELYFKSIKFKEDK